MDSPFVVCLRNDVLDNGTYIRFLRVIKPHPAVVRLAVLPHVSYSNDFNHMFRQAGIVVCRKHPALAVQHRLESLVPTVIRANRGFVEVRAHRVYTPIEVWFEWGGLVGMVLLGGPLATVGAVGAT